MLGLRHVDIGSSKKFIASWGMPFVRSPAYTMYVGWLDVDRLQIFMGRPSEENPTADLMRRFLYIGFRSHTTANPHCRAGWCAALSLRECDGAGKPLLDRSSHGLESP